jgi:16S rRNA processing protein RimM
VRALHNFGAGDLIEIEFPGGETEFLPFTDASVPAVDIAGGRVVVVLPKYDDESLFPQGGEGAVPTKSTKD